MTTGWILSLFIAFLPALWFGLATSYKRISALFYENRNNLFAAYFGFDLINNAISLGILESLSFSSTGGICLNPRDAYTANVRRPP